MRRGSATAPGCEFGTRSDATLRVVLSSHAGCELDLLGCRSGACAAPHGSLGERNFVCRGLPAHSIFYAGEVVRSAIRGLGNSISEVAISFLVAGAVNACPQAALQIVRVAVGETPPKLHATIVAAAVADVPDPYEYVIVVHRREGSSEPPPVLEKRNAFTVSKVFVTDGKSVTPDSKSVVAEGKAVATEGKEAVGPEVLSYEPGTGPGSMTLAEAIIQAAIEGGSTAGLDALTNSVNFILLSTTPPLEGDPADPNSIAIPLPTPSPVSP